MPSESLDLRLSVLAQLTARFAYRLWVVGAENAVRALDLQRSAPAQRRCSTCSRSWRGYLNALRRSADGVQAPRAPVIIRAGQHHGRDFRHGQRQDL